MIQDESLKSAVTKFEIKMDDKNFLCRQLGFDRHMHEDELEEQDLFETNWQNTGIC